MPFISIVEDDESVREAVAGLLKALGFEARAFACAEDFLRSDQAETSNEFADPTPRSPPAHILALYHAQKPLSPEALRRFVVAHFDLPADPAAPPLASEFAPLRQHIEVLWERMAP